MNETEIKELNKYLTLSEDEIKKRYEILSEITVTKLQNLSSSSDAETKNKISETILKIENEEANFVNLIKLKTLSSNL